ncbi:MAG: FIST C-terminal domain-containing protein [Magnetovibrio sp.]|nr:FIST C-terminal domain-containing protein [Magnetovibrio sp.]
MKVAQAHIFETSKSELGKLSKLADLHPQLVLVFGTLDHFSSPDFYNVLRHHFPESFLVGCSTAGEITNDGVEDKTTVVTALHFDRTNIQVASATAAEITDSFNAGKTIGEQLSAPNLSGVLLFSKGLEVNGSSLIDGIVSSVGKAVPISGGLAGDDGAFQRTLVLTNNTISETGVVGVGLYGNALRFGHGSFGGWEPFGPARKVTRTEGNILYELDGENALDIYKRYLGDFSKDLPASGLLFPFEILNKNHEPTGLIRTILGTNESEGSLILAGTVRENGYLRLMHATTDALVAGAEKAAIASKINGTLPEEKLALLVSCVGRKLVMGDQVEDEVEIVAKHLGQNVTLSGFYSYGEISPMQGILDCKLHNQTMTIAFLFEDEEQ